MPRHSLLLVLLSAALLFIGFRLVCMLSDFPVFAGDSRTFLPAAVELKRDHRWENPAFRPPHVVDASRPDLYTYHGFLSPLVLALLSPWPDYHGIRFALGIVMLAYALCLAFLLHRAGHGLPEIDPRAGAVGVALLLLAVGYLGDLGRPELLATALVAAGLLAVSLAPSGAASAAILGATLGGLAAADPIPSLLAALLAVGWVFLQAPTFRAALGRTALLGGLAVLVLAFLLLFYPHRALWLEGMRLHAETAEAFDSESGILKPWFASPGAMGFGFFVLAGFGACLHFVGSRWGGAAGWKKAGVAFVGLLFLVLFWHYAVRIGAKCYNARPLIPLFAFALASRFFQTSRPRWNRWLLPGLCAVACLACAVDLSRQALLFRAYLASGLRYDRAAAELQALADRSTGIEISPDLYSLFVRYDHVTVHDLAPLTAQTYVLQQVVRGLRRPPEIEGYTLVYENFSPVRPRFCGIPVGNTAGGYNYAIYEKNRP